MEIKINVIELACNLAERDTIKDVLSNKELFPHYNEEDDLYNEDEEGDTTYKEDVQDVFNDLYDYYYTIIEECKCGE